LGKKDALIGRMENKHGGVAHLAGIVGRTNYANGVVGRGFLAD